MESIARLQCFYWNDTFLLYIWVTNPPNRSIYVNDKSVLLGDMEIDPNISAILNQFVVYYRQISF